MVNNALRIAIYTHGIPCGAEIAMIRKSNSTLPVIIDHEPLKQSESSNPQTANPASPPVSSTNARPTSRTGTFGKRQTHKMPSSAVTDTFFTSGGEDSDFKKRKIRRVTPDAPGKQRLPMGSLAAALTIAFALPSAFIYYTEKHGFSNIDPITTASIGSPSDLGAIRISKVGMTKMLKNGTHVITAYGTVENRTGKEENLPELEIILLDESGRNIQSWVHPMDKKQIGSDQTFRFISSAIDITGDAKTVIVKPVQ